MYLMSEFNRSLFYKLFDQSYEKEGLNFYDLKLYHSWNIVKFFFNNLRNE